MTAASGHTRDHRSFAEVFRLMSPTVLFVVGFVHPPTPHQTTAEWSPPGSDWGDRALGHPRREADCWWGLFRVTGWYCSMYVCVSVVFSPDLHTAWVRVWQVYEKAVGNTKERKHKRFFNNNKSSVFPYEFLFVSKLNLKEKQWWADFSVVWNGQVQKWNPEINQPLPQSLSFAVREGFVCCAMCFASEIETWKLVWCLKKGVNQTCDT